MYAAWWLIHHRYEKGLVDLGEGIILIMMLFMFGAGQLIWPDGEMSDGGRLILFVALAYFAYRVGFGAGKTEK